MILGGNTLGSVAVGGLNDSVVSGPITYYYTFNGGLSFNGASTVKVSISYQSTGGVTFGGSANVSYIPEGYVPPEPPIIEQDDRKIGRSRRHRTNIHIPPSSVNVNCYGISLLRTRHVEQVRSLGPRIVPVYPFNVYALCGSIVIRRTGITKKQLEDDSDDAEVLMILASYLESEFD